MPPFPAFPECLWFVLFLGIAVEISLAISSLSVMICSLWCPFLTDNLSLNYLTPQVTSIPVQGSCTGHRTHRATHCQLSASPRQSQWGLRALHRQTRVLKEVKSHGTTSVLLSRFGVATKLNHYRFMRYTCQFNLQEDRFITQRSGTTNKIL